MPSLLDRARKAIASRSSTPTTATNPVSVVTQPTVNRPVPAPNPPEPSASCPVPVENVPERAPERRAGAIERIIAHLDSRFPSGTVMRASQLAELHRAEREVEWSAEADEAGAELGFESMLFHAERVRDITAQVVGQLAPWDRDE